MDKNDIDRIEIDGIIVDRGDSLRKGTYKLFKKRYEQVIEQKQRGDKVEIDRIENELSRLLKG